MQSALAVKAFVEACERGSIRLKANNGRILKLSEVPRFADLQWKWQEKRTVVEFTSPRNTYLVIADLNDPRPDGFVRSCVLVSRELRRADAEFAFTQSAPAGKPKQTWVPNMYMDEWSFDLPELGYRKRMQFSNDGSVKLAVDAYKSASN